MFKRIKSILFVVCVVMVFTAQANRPDDKSIKIKAVRRFKAVHKFKFVDKSLVKLFTGNPSFNLVFNLRVSKEISRVFMLLLRLYLLRIIGFLVDSTVIIGSRVIIFMTINTIFILMSTLLQPWSFQRAMEFQGLMDRIIIMIKGHFICKKGRSMWQ